MKINVIENAKRNIIAGAVNKIIALICPLITRTIIQMILGAEYLGLNSLFMSVISALSLSELGISAAIVYCMYKPVAENDVGTVNALLNFYRKAYAVVGSVIFVLGLFLIPFLEVFIKGSYPKDINLTGLYLLFLLNTVISYFMYAYKSSLIVVYQRDDINSYTNMFVTLALTITQVAVLIATHNYIFYIVMMPIFTIINNLRIALVVNKMFPQYHCEGKLSDCMMSDIKQKLSGTVISRTCQVSRNSFDSICTSAFIGLTVTAIYNNYYYIITGVINFLAIISNALAGGIGNHVATRSIDENYNELKKLDFVYMWISGWATVCILCLSQPFMTLWMGKEMLFSYDIVVLLAVYFYLLKVGDMRMLYVQAAGLWWEQRTRSIAEAVANIVLNILLGKIWGVYGIISATILTIFFINQIYGSSIVFKYYFGKNKLNNYYFYHIKYFLMMVVSALMSLFSCNLIHFKSSLLTILVRLIICTVTVNLWFIFIYRKSKEFNYAKSIIVRRKRRVEF